MPSVAFLRANRAKSFLPMSVPIFFNYFPYALSLFENLRYVIVGRDEVDAFRFLRTVWRM